MAKDTKRRGDHVDDISDMHATLYVLHALANAGILEQRMGATDCVPRWHCKPGGHKRLKKILREY